MNASETRYRITSALLQSGQPVTLDELGQASGVPRDELRKALNGLVREGLVVEGMLLLNAAETQYVWAARWAQQKERREVQSQRALGQRTQSSADEGIHPESEASCAFHDYILHEYEPPRDKHFLVFLQCSVRRPFSRSPSHAAMRRAIRTATGADPRKDSDRCPVHVVVLASQIGPVPYELEDVHPANVRGGGVKHFDRPTYARLKPLLAQRMADYLTVHGSQYQAMVSFTEGRYGEVMQEALRIAGVVFPVLPSFDGPRIGRIGSSMPRKYWDKYWIQLYLAILEWLLPDEQREAEARLRALDVRYG